MFEKGTQTFDFIGRYIGHFEAITNNTFLTEETGSFFSNLNYILTTTFGSTYIAPLMHYRECFGEYRIVEYLIKLDNLFSAAWLTGFRGLQTRAFILLRKMDEIKRQQLNPKIAADAFLGDSVLTYEYQDEKANTVVDIDKLYDLFETERWGSFSGTKINKTRYLLLKLDLLLSNFHIQLYFNKTLSSVEHIMPQKIANTTWDISEDDHKHWLHKLGNVVLIDRKKNASFGNLPYKDKIKKYQGYIENRANTNFVFMSFKDWDIEHLQLNHYRVVKVLKDYYSGNSLLTLKALKKKQSSLSTPYLFN